MKKIVILFTTHILNEYVHQQYQKLYNDLATYADVICLLQTDTPLSIPSDMNYYSFTIDSLNMLGYESYAETIVPGSNHFPLLQFYRDNPTYDYYWNIEFDVQFTGNWNLFFSFFEGYKEDFISSHIEFFHENPGWDHWNAMTLKSIYIPTECYIKSFNPIYRISNKALNFLSEFLLYNYGHHELLMPTVLYANNFSLLDFGGDGSFALPSDKSFYTSFHYDNCPQTSTMRYRPLYQKKDMIIPNKLYHPVKS